MAAKKIFCVIAYDIENDRKRVKISKLLAKHGTRINLSVFECMITAKQLEKIKETTAKWLDKRTDTMVFYTFCIDCFTKIAYQPEVRQNIKSIKIV